MLRSLHLINTIVRPSNCSWIKFHTTIERLHQHSQMCNLLFVIVCTNPYAGCYVAILCIHVAIHTYLKPATYVCAQARNVQVQMSTMHTGMYAGYISHTFPSIDFAQHPLLNDTHIAHCCCTILGPKQHLKAACRAALECVHIHAHMQKYQHMQKCQCSICNRSR